jgi:hypothetical protein
MVMMPMVGHLIHDELDVFWAYKLLLVHFGRCRYLMYFVNSQYECELFCKIELQSASIGPSKYQCIL